MPTYVVLLKYTNQGAMNIRKTVERAHQNRALMSARDVKLITVYWTQGHYDLVVTAEAPDEATMMGAVLRVVEGATSRPRHCGPSMKARWKPLSRSSERRRRAGAY